MIDAVREAIHAVIEDLGAKALSAKMGVELSTLYRWGEIGGKAIPWDRFRQLHLVSNDLRPITSLCRELGGVFVPCPDTEAEDVEQGALHALKEFADLMQESSRALLDGSINREELARIRREGAEAQRALASYLGELERHAKAARRQR